MLRHVLTPATALSIVALSIIAMAPAALVRAAEPQQAPAQSQEPTNSATASQLALDLRACNHLGTDTERNACKTETRQNAVYPVRTPMQPEGRFERQDN